MDWLIGLTVVVMVVGVIVAFRKDVKESLEARRARKLAYRNWNRRRHF